MTFQQNAYATSFLESVLHTTPSGQRSIRMEVYTSMLSYNGPNPFEPVIHGHLTLTDIIRISAESEISTMYINTSRRTVKLYLTFTSRERLLFTERLCWHLTSMNSGLRLRTWTPETMSSIESDWNTTQDGDTASTQDTSVTTPTSEEWQL